MKLPLTQSRLKTVFEYESGDLIWKEAGFRRTVGAVAGSTTSRGYRKIMVDGKRYLAHRLVYLWHHGTMPAEIDHIDGNPSNNRIENLREANHQENCRNRKRIANTHSGFKGVQYQVRSGKWIVRIQANGVRYCVGSFDNPIEAAKAYDKAALEHFGKFAWLNFSADIAA